MTFRFATIAALAFASASVSALAVPVTGITGGGQPFDNLQPTLGITQSIVNLGIFPSRGPGGFATGDTIGFIDNFAGNFTGGDTITTDGRLVSINTNIPLFAVIGTTYGGDGSTTFAMPNLVGTVEVGASNGGGSLPPLAVGQTFGSPTVTLSTSQIPAHDHTLPGGGTTGTTGGGQPFDNRQPSLVLHPMIATTGVFPSRGGSSTSGGAAVFLGEIGYFAGNYTPAGWAPADGSLIPIAQDTALFSILGTFYGGNGTSNFALPDLQDRVIVGASANAPVGSMYGQDSTTLTTAQMPAHDHTLPGGGTTGFTGAGLPVNNDQPSLAMEYLIATSGIFPSRDGTTLNDTLPTLGEIVPFAGNFVPDGWMLADGQLLSISQNTALFSLLGTFYGGDGKTNFALPDLRGRTLFDWGPGYILGGVYGSDANTLSVANLPPHDHTLPAPPPPAVPEPLTLALMAAGLAGMGALRRRKKAD